MGGYGSGRHGARPVAEQSLRFSVSLLRPQLRSIYERGQGAAASGNVRWSGVFGYAASCSYTIEHTPAGLVVTLHYSRDGVATSTPLAITTSAPQLGGVRFWWACPGCGRRCAVLFAPLGFWRCGRCERITYASSNASDSGLWERMERRLAQLP